MKNISLSAVRAVGGERGGVRRLVCGLMRRYDSNCLIHRYHALSIKANGVRRPIPAVLLPTWSPPKGPMINRIPQPVLATSETQILS